MSSKDFRMFVVDVNLQISLGGRRKIAEATNQVRLSIHYFVQSDVRSKFKRSIWWSDQVKGFPKLINQIKFDC